MKNKLKFILILFSGILAQDPDKSQILSPFADYQISSERYLTNTKGSIMMNVNVWGHVKSPGNHIVYDGIDFASLLSIVGGPIDGANLKDVRLYREIPDENGILVYQIDLNEFIRYSLFPINPLYQVSQDGTKVIIIRTFYTCCYI